MDAEFWRSRWRSNDIGFHESEVNPLLVAHLKELWLAKGSRIFVPLCGKTLDIAWLLDSGYRVVGVEMVETAVEQLFAELGVKPDVFAMGAVKRYSARAANGSDIDIFVGDFFDVSKEMLGCVDAVYDRAALVALPSHTRCQYTAHLMAITQKAPQLLICFEYNQELMAGPPFSISDKEVHQHYNSSYGLTVIASQAVKGGVKGKVAAQEKVWLLQGR